MVWIAFGYRIPESWTLFELKFFVGSTVNLECGVGAKDVGFVFSVLSCRSYFGPAISFKKLFLFFCSCDCGGTGYDVPVSTSTSSLAVALNFP